MVDIADCTMVVDEEKATRIDAGAKKAVSALLRTIFGEHIDANDAEGFSDNMVMLCVAGVRAPLDLIGMLTSQSVRNGLANGQSEEAMREHARQQFEGGLSIAMRTTVTNLGKIVLETRCKLGLISDAEAEALNKLAEDDIEAFAKYVAKVGADEVMKAANAVTKDIN